MSSTIPSENASKPLRALHPTRSFTRMEAPAAGPPARSRAKTFQASKTTETLSTDDLHPLGPVTDEADQGVDVFEKRHSPGSDTEEAVQRGEQPYGNHSHEDGLDELPVELASITDRFVGSLSAKVHNAPPSIETISELFQDFYVRAESHIATHISTLASRINRETSPNKSGTSKTNAKNSMTNTSSPEKNTTHHQMLTASEVTERRKARKQLLYKRVALEETVERRACESIYGKIWRHKSTLDEVRDEKLRSKTAALALLGTSLRDLGIEIPNATEEKEKEASTRLSLARESLAKMNDEKYPLGKLRHLITTHKAIVDTLTALLPSSSSADEILPTLIYTLITSPPEGINIISNFQFIQRFRSANKMDGEAAYCLTNLEAAITFLEDVDLSSISTEAPDNGQPRLLNATTTPSAERGDPLRSTKESSIATVTSTSAVPEFSKSGKGAASATVPRAQLSTSTAQQRRLSNLFQPPAKVLGAANDVVRNTADQGLKNISNTLDNSFNFVFGRLKEMQSRGGPELTVVPKTLDDARRLVTSPSILDDKDPASEEGSIQDGPSEDPSLSRAATLRPEDRRRAGTDGWRSPRDRSADSNQSSDSKRPAIGPRFNPIDQATPSPSAGSSIFTPSPGATPLESMKNFGNTFNPLNHIPGMIRGFGRSTPDTPAGATPTTAIPERLKPLGSTDSPSSSKIDPPIRRFLEVTDAQDLRLGDIAELLEDYKRLATAFLT